VRDARSHALRGVPDNRHPRVLFPNQMGGGSEDVDALSVDASDEQQETTAVHARALRALTLSSGRKRFRSHRRG
jgi:hypothetical protein